VAYEIPMAKPKLTNEDFCRAAKRLGCEVAAIKAIAEQESLGGGFDNQDRPKILFERHLFHKLTKGRFDAEHPDISNRTAGGYGSSASQYSRFNLAFSLDQRAALMSTSWGAFQILGSNYAVCGFSSLSAFIEAMRDSSAAQLDAFCEFVESNGLDDELSRHDWAGFARGYNGRNYKINQYDVKIAAAYKKFRAENIDCSEVNNDHIILEVPPVSAAVSPEISATATTPVLNPTVSQPETAKTETPPNASVLDTLGQYSDKASEIGAKVDKMSTSSFISVLLKYALAIGSLVIGFVKDNWEWLIVGVVILAIAVWYLNHSKERVTERIIAKQ
jgi:hypothetical protein